MSGLGIGDPWEWARGVFDAWNEAGAAASASFWAEAIEWHDPPELPDAGVVRGRERVVAHLRDWEAEGVFDLKFEVEDVRVAGDEVIVFTRARGRGVRSGTPTEGLPAFYVFRVEDGLVTRTRGFLDRQQALAAAGLTE